MIEEADVIFVCAPSPTIDGKQDPSAVVNVFHELALKDYKGVVCLKSTVLPGTCNKLAGFYDLRVVHNPEFLTAAKPFEDFMNQKSIIISGPDIKAINDVREVYKKLLPNCPVLAYYDYKTTELAKYYSNCFLAAKVTFANEMYELCQKVNCDYDNVREATISQGLVAPNHTRVPGPDGKIGYGLGCLPKETEALINFCNDNNLKAEVLKATVLGNNRRRKFDKNCVEIGTDKIVI